MDINVSYHWVYMDYLSPNFKTGYWGPIARAAIEIYADLPTADGPKAMRGMYKYLNIPITGTMDPKDEIIKGIEKFAEDQNIAIELDCLVGKCGSWDSEL